MTHAVINLLRTVGLLMPLIASGALAQGADSSAGPAPTAASPAAVAAEPATPAPPDLKKGAAIAAAVCAACHGIDGNALAPTFPKLAGQHAGYIAKQLTNFKVVPPAQVAERPNAIMSPIAAAMSLDDMKNVGAYYETQVLKPSQAKDQATIALGQKIWRGGVTEKGVPACAACHGPAGAGIPVQYPRVGGQWQEYLALQLNNFKGGLRNNNVAMTNIASRLSDEEMKAVTDYAAGLR